MKPNKIKAVKYIEIKDISYMSSALQTWIINKDVTNAGLISMALNRLVRKFLRDLQEIPLSEELQYRESNLPTKSLPIKKVKK